MPTESKKYLKFDCRGEYVMKISATAEQSKSENLLVTNLTTELQTDVLMESFKRYNHRFRCCEMCDVSVLKNLLIWEYSCPS